MDCTTCYCRNPQCPRYGQIAPRAQVKMHDRRFPQGENDQHFWVFQRNSRVLEDHRKISQPGNRLARLVKSGFPQDRVVAALVEVHDDPFRLDFDHTPCCHEFGSCTSGLRIMFRDLS